MTTVIKSLVLLFTVLAVGWPIAVARSRIAPPREFFQESGGRSGEVPTLDKS
jgi:hypothetical protein